MPLIELRDGLAQAVIAVAVFGAIACLLVCAYAAQAMGRVVRYRALPYAVFWGCMTLLVVMLGIVLVVEVKR